MSIFKITEGHGLDVILIHGWGCDHRHMQPIVEQLKDQYQVTNIDLPGAGKSPWSTNIKTIHDIADHVLPELPKRAIYMGWSFGGLVSMSIAARYPERVKQFIGIATTPKFVESSNWPGLPHPGFRPSFEDVYKIGLKPKLLDFCEAEFAAINPKPPAYKELIQLIDENRDLDVLLKEIDICDATYLREEFRKIRCPIDLIQGELDECISTNALDQMQKLNANVKIHRIPSEGHLNFWTHPDEFKHVLNEILHKERTAIV